MSSDSDKTKKVSEENRSSERGFGVSNPSIIPLQTSAAQYPWIAHDPIIISRTTAFVQHNLPSRLDVLSPSGLSRSRSLTRPERSQAPVTPRQKNILAVTPSSPFEPWRLFYNAVTCCIPGPLMAACGMASPETQKAWREKVALCFIAAFLCGALGFLTFGLQTSICKIRTLI